ncbi:unnamed protein product [Prorocentrum cordatum]|uniref:Uncharacterized protein n=1 Tax=Prorocentrum cordatum TaxID=2364126 RepID=A0ABN9U091_9DINO|nr:unnamed protein product [Polarella glacialis]
MADGFSAAGAEVPRHPEATRTRYCTIEHMALLVRIRTLQTHIETLSAEGLESQAAAASGVSAAAPALVAAAACAVLAGSGAAARMRRRPTAGVAQAPPTSRAHFLSTLGGLFQKPRSAPRADGPSASVADRVAAAVGGLFGQQPARHAPPSPRHPADALGDAFGRVAEGVGGLLGGAGQGVGGLLGGAGHHGAVASAAPAAPSPSWPPALFGQPEPARHAPPSPRHPADALGDAFGRVAEGVGGLLGGAGHHGAVASAAPAAPSPSWPPALFGQPEPARHAPPSPRHPADALGDAFGRVAEGVGGLLGGAGHHGAVASAAPAPPSPSWPPTFAVVEGIEGLFGGAGKASAPRTPSGAVQGSGEGINGFMESVGDFFSKGQATRGPGVVVSAADADGPGATGLDGFVEAVGVAFGAKPAAVAGRAEKPAVAAAGGLGGFAEAMGGFLGGGPSGPAVMVAAADADDEEPGADSPVALAARDEFDGISALAGAVGGAIGHAQAGASIAVAMAQGIAAQVERRDNGRAAQWRLAAMERRISQLDRRAEDLIGAVERGGIEPDAKARFLHAADEIQIQRALLAVQLDTEQTVGEWLPAAREGAEQLARGLELGSSCVADGVVAVARGIAELRPSSPGGAQLLDERWPSAASREETGGPVDEPTQSPAGDQLGTTARPPPWRRPTGRALPPWWRRPARRLLQPPRRWRERRAPLLGRRWPPSRVLPP